MTLATMQVQKTLKSAGKAKEQVSTVPLTDVFTQMALAEQPFNHSTQLANQAQAMFAANQLSNYPSFLSNNLGGVALNMSTDSGTDATESTSNSGTNGRLRSTSPTSSNHSIKDEKSRRVGKLFRSR